MLDAFLEVVYEKEKQASIEEQVVESLMHLPNEELHKIVSGEVKLAYHDTQGGCWLDQFKGTDFYQSALDLETQSLELDVQQQQENQAPAEPNPIWKAQDAIRVQKRMLELDMRKQEAGMADAGGGEELPEPEEPIEEPPPVEEPVEQEAAKAAAVNEFASARGALVIEAMRKEANEQLPPSMRAGKAVGKTWLGPASAVIGGASGAVAGAGAGQRLMSLGQKAGLGGRASSTLGAAGALGGGALGYMAGRGVSRFGQGFGAGAVESKEKELAKKKEKTASAFQAADAWGREMASMEKEAIMLAGAANALTQGAKALGGRVAGAAKTVGQAGKGLASAVGSGNVQQMGQAVKNTAGLAGRGAVQAVRKNPLMAAGAAGVGGLALGRATAG
jgi:hypothetical protein